MKEEEEEEGEEKKKKNEQLTQEKKGKKKSKVVKSYDWVLFVGPLYVFNYNIAIKLWVMETKNTFLCFQFP